MNAEADARGGTVAMIERAVAALGDGALMEAAVQMHLGPLFSRVLERRATAIDLANHSLGRPLDATAVDVAEAVSLWQQRLGDAWDAWLDEMRAHRARFARLLGAPDDHVHVVLDDLDALLPDQRPDLRRAVRVVVRRHLQPGGLERLDQVLLTRPGPPLSEARPELRAVPSGGGVTISGKPFRAPAPISSSSRRSSSIPARSFQSCPR